jgi:hypothetical protein
MKGPSASTAVVDQKSALGKEFLYVAPMTGRLANQTSETDGNYRVRIKFQYQDQLTLKQEPGWYPDQLFLQQEATG